MTPSTTGELFVAGETIGQFGTPTSPYPALPDWFVAKVKAADGALY